MQYHFLFDTDKCCACHACTVACLDQNDTDVEAGDVAFRKAYNLEKETKGTLDCVYLSTACMHCSDAPCITACPAGCIRKDAETGMTVYDNNKLYRLPQLCLWHVPSVQFCYRSSDGKMVKCDGCYIRLKNGMEPACVRACAFGALKCLDEQSYQKAEAEKAVNAMLHAVK